MNESLAGEACSLESLVGRLADEFLRRQEAGERPDIEEYAARHPPAADLLRKVLASLQLLDASLTGAAAPPAGDTDGQASGTLGDFRLLREVGRGGMGVVYEAEQVSLRRRVALKVLSLAGGLDLRHLRRFRTEAQAAAGLHHTNIAPVYAVGYERGVHYYAMQFIDGPSLADVIAELRRQGGAADGPTTVCRRSGEPEARTWSDAALSTLSAQRSAGGREFWRAAARLGIEAAEALDHAHQQGVVHRDVKPANLMLDGPGHLWVVDFGLARLQGDAGLTMTGDLVGTLRYMSPEQALASRAVVDHRTDVYSLGATLYELLTLTPAFPGDDRQDVLRRIADEDPPAPRCLDATVPADLETVVLKAMAKEPAERYATAEDLADDLRRFLEDRPVAARRPSWGQRARRWLRRHRPLVAGVGAAAALLLLGLVVGLIGYAIELGQLANQRDANEKKALADRKKAEGELYEALLKHARAVRLARSPGYRAEVWTDLRQAAGLDVPEKDPQAIAAEVLACLGDPIGLNPVPAPAVERLSPPRPPAWFEEEIRKKGLTQLARVAAAPEGRFVAVAVNALNVFNSVELYGRAEDFPAPKESKGAGVAPPPVAGGSYVYLGTAESPFGHVYDLALDHDGTRLVAGFDEGFRVWELPRPGWGFARGGAVRSTVGGGTFHAVAMHPGGWLVATAGRQVELWSCPDGRPVAKLPIPEPGARVEFSADGQLLLATVGDRAVLGWPVGDTPEKRRLHGHEGAGVPAVAFSPDGRLLASAAKDRTVKIWDPRTGRLLHTCHGHRERIEAAAFSPDGRLLATGDFGGAVALWDPASGKNLAWLAGPNWSPGPPGQVWRLQFDGTGRCLAAGGIGGVAVWSVRPRPGGADVERRATVPGLCALDLAFHPGGSSVVCMVPAGPDNSCQLVRCDLAPGAAPRPLGVAAAQQARGLNFDPSGRLLAYVTPAHRLGRWDWDGEATVPCPDQATWQWAPAPGGRWAATSNPDGAVVIVDLDSGARPLRLPPEDSEVWGLAWAPDGRHLAVGLSDGALAVWDLGQVRARLAEFGVDVPPTGPDPG